MKPLVLPSLVNGPCGDPALYLEFMFEHRALLFDLGNLAQLPPRKLLRVSHGFVSHAHMDHFAGFDQLLRVRLGREPNLHLFGPSGFIDQVEHKLCAYTWNLVHNYSDDFTIRVTELDPSGRGTSAEFHTREGFARHALAQTDHRDGILLREPGFSVHYTALDHRIPSLAFCLQEERHVNIWPNRVAERGLPLGPWLSHLKQAVLDEAPDHTPIALPDGRQVQLGKLRHDLVRVVPGQRLAYVTDCADTRYNRARILALIQDADMLYIEAPFLQQDAAVARDKAHLTAAAAGELAGQAGVAQVRPFHFSARYHDAGQALAEEVQRHWQAALPRQ